MPENIIYNIQSDADMRAFRQVQQEIDQAGNALEDMTRETNNAASAANRMEGGWKSLIKIDISGWINSAVGVFRNMVSASKEWVTEIDSISTQLHITTEEASGLLVAMQQVGVDGSKALSEFQAVQGRMFDELKVQEEQEKVLADLSRKRMDVLKDLGKAEASHAATVADLEAERVELLNENFDDIMSKRNEQLSDLERNYKSSVGRQSDVEKQETEELSKRWAERAQRYQKDYLQAKDSFEQQARNANNYREFLAAKEQFEKRSDELQSSLKEDQDEYKSDAERKIEAAEMAADREREIFEQRKADIIASADEELAQARQRNAERVLDVEAGIEKEKLAWADRQETFIRSLADIAESETEAKEKTGELGRLFGALGIDMFNAEGGIRGVVDLLGELQSKIGEMPPEEAAAILSKLGIKETTDFFMRGISLAEGMTEAQEKNVLVTAEQLAAQQKFDATLAGVKQTWIGVSNSIIESLGGWEQVSKWVEDLTDRFIEWTEGGGLDRVGERIEFVAEGIAWMAEKASEAWEMLTSLKELLSEIGDLLSEKFGEGAFALGGMLGQGLKAGGNLLEGLGLDIPGFAKGGVVEGPIGKPQLALVHGGETITPPGASSSIINSSTNNNQPVTVNINAPVYGVNDLQAAIQGAIRGADQDLLMRGVSNG